MREHRKSRALTRLFMILLVSASLWTAMAALAMAAKKPSKPATVKNVKVTASGTSAHKIKWKKVKKATGYQVYCRDYSSKSKLYKKVKTLKGASKVSCVIKKRKQGCAYAYVVRAYKKNKAGVTYGDFSTIAYGFLKKTVTQQTQTTPSTEAEASTEGTPSTESGAVTENTPSAGTTPSTEAAETEAATEAAEESAGVETAADIILNPTKKQKYRKVFGDASLSMRYPGGYYASRAKAEANMVSVSVRTWDFVKGTSGEKRTRTWTIRVHRSLAATVRKIFEEIYNDPEKFPIHELGGYDWRGGHSEHNTGTAIDINWTENYMVNVATGVISCGKYWKPGEDPYSIPKDGVVARIFKKYGFNQGDWGDSKDYMHFSYFGT